MDAVLPASAFSSDDDIVVLVSNTARTNKGEDDQKKKSEICMDGIGGHGRLNYYLMKLRTMTSTPATWHTEARSVHRRQYQIRGERISLAGSCTSMASWPSQESNGTW